MNREGEGPSLDLSAVGSGVLWGLILMLLGAVIQGIMAYRSPLSSGAELFWTIGWQALGGLCAGFMAGRRAGGAGWLHGGLAGVGMALAVAGVMGVLTELPSMGALLRGLGAGISLGAFAGIIGVNFGGR